MKNYKKIILITIGIIIILIVSFFIYMKTTFISKKEIKELIANNMGVSISEIYFEQLELEYDKEYYEVELYYNNQDYEYKIDAKNGMVIYTNFQKPNANNSNSSTATESTEKLAPSSITLEEAVTIALNHASLEISEVQFQKQNQEYDDGIQVYEIEFYSGEYEYEYDIRIDTGEIISYHKSIRD